jgi:uncharacterized protein with HEPN domain
MSPSHPEFLRHILDECAFILRAAGNKTQNEISNDPTVSRALVRSLEIIGEATKKLEEEFTAKYPQVNWKEMAGMRDKLIHDYFGVDYDIVFNTIKKDIPELHNEITRIIEIESKE